MISTDNAASLRVAEQAGFKQFATATRYGLGRLVFERMPVEMDIPVIETERLILRGHRIDDFPSYAAMWAEPVVTRFIGGAPLSEEDAWAKFLRITRAIGR